VIVASLTASIASAEGCQDARGVVQHIFQMADENQDGVLTRAEYGEAGLERYGVSFDESDVNSDGETSLAEYLEIYERYHSPKDRINL